MNFLKIKDKKYFPGNIFFMEKTILLKVELLKKLKKERKSKKKTGENTEKCGNKQMLHVKQ